MKLLPVLLALVLAGTAAAQTPEQKIASLEARVAKLEAIVAKLQSPSPAAKPAPGKSTNKHGIPDDVFARIKAKAEQQWPDDYTMQKFTIQAEVKSYKELQER